MANCKMMLEGNILAWKSDFIEFHETAFRNITLQSLCGSDHKYLLVNKITPFDGAKEYCKVHGGMLATPSSPEENEMMHSMLMENIEVCTRIWLDFLQLNNSFSNFKKKSTIDVCAVMGDDSKWQGKQESYCSLAHFCFICEFEKNPMVTLKGLCETTTYAFNYYFESTNAYLGYVGGSITNENGVWIMTNVPGTEVIISEVQDAHLIGRMNWLVQDSFCSLENKSQQLTVSICRLSTEFTCTSGQCIGLMQRCDNLQHCDDNSDEEDCVILTPIEGYNPLEPPQLAEGWSNLLTTVDIVQFDEIDNMQSKLTLTMDITISWTDPRILAKYLPDFDNTSTTYTEITGNY